MTCCTSLAPGTCSMLMTFAFGAAAWATSAMRSIDLRGRRPARKHDRVGVIRDGDLLAGKQLVKLLLERG